MNKPALQTCPGLDSAFIHAHKNFGSGTILEFGVGGGFSYSWLAWNISKYYPHDNLIGFDSWQGLPAETKNVWHPEFHKKGNYKHEKIFVYNRAKELGVSIEGDPRFKIVDGFFSDSLTPELRSTIENVILINSDIDLHSSAIEWLNWVKPLLRPGVVVYTDDWKFPTIKEAPDRCGVSLAFEEWLLENSSVKLKTVWECKTSQRFFEVASV